MTLIPDLERDLVEAAGRVRLPRTLARRVAPFAAAAVVVSASAVAIALWSGDEAPPDRALPAGEEREPPPAPPPSSRRPQPVPGSLSPPVILEFDGARYRMFGFRSRRGDMICVRVNRIDTMPGIDSETCAGERNLRRGLRDTGVLKVGGGGGEHLSIAGFTEASILDVYLEGTRRRHRIVMTEPWRPKPWRGEPIRAFLAIVDGTPIGAVPHRKLLRIRVLPAAVE
jgi:hypothetical protein